MCGITGIIDFSLKSRKEAILQMTYGIKHRGPDDQGHYFERNPDYSIGLGHRRLSILDLSQSAHQPMCFRDLYIVYNGEIYNFREIKAELIELGYGFESTGDTEVILKAYHAWGTGMIDRFIGMFAIALFDSNKNQLILTRDRAGVKPLFYYWDGSLFLFGSELKALMQHPDFRRKLDNDSVAKYLTLGYVPSPFSIFENTKKVRPGHHVILDLKRRKISEKRYWSIADYSSRERLEISYAEARSELETLFRSAFSYRLVADVETGVFFSGGYDSTLVTAILQADSSKPLKTFTIGFEEHAFDESKYARSIAKHLGTNHHEFICTENDAIDMVANLADVYDEPISDNSVVPTLLLSKLTSQHVKVALSADGGDELFGGYNKYYSNLAFYERSLSQSNITRKIINYWLLIAQKMGVSRIMKNGDLRIENLIKLTGDRALIDGVLTKIQARIFSEDQIKALLSNKASSYLTDTAFDNVAYLTGPGSLLDKLCTIDFQSFMTDDILVKVDRASMHYGLEAREPLLDHRIAEFTARLPFEYKYQNGNRKRILKDIAHKYVPKVMLDRPKTGFSMPLDNWLKKDLRYIVEDNLSTTNVEKTNMFNPHIVAGLVNGWKKGGLNISSKLWRIAILQQWLIKHNLHG